MCPTDVVVLSGDEHHQRHDQSEKESTCGGQDASGGKDSHHCTTVPGSGVAAEASAALSGGEHDELLSKMRDACKRQDCSTEDVSDATLLRFLKARSMNVVKAAKMFVEYKQWRASCVPLGYVPHSECSREMASKKLFLQGRSKQGWAVVVVLSRNHDAVRRDLDELKRFIIHFLDKSLASAAPEAEKLMAIVDLKELAYKNCDTRALIAGFGLLQAYYPDRLAKMLIINAPSFFMGIWKVVVRFVDAQTRSKIAFVGRDQITETCLSDIDVDVLPALYGGKADLTLLQDVVVPNWPPGQTI